MVFPTEGAAIPSVPGSGSTQGAYSTSMLNSLSQQYAAARAASPQPASSEPSVYLGMDSVHVIAPPERGNAPLFRERQGDVPVPQTKTLSQMMTDFDHWNIKRKQDMARKLALAGFLGSPYKGETLDEFVKRQDYISVEQGYAQLLQSASSRYAAGQKVSPNQLLNQYIDYNKSTGLFAGSAGAGGAGGTGSPYANQTRTETNTSKSVDIWSPMDAKGLARATLQRELGRDPTQAEFEDFVAALQAKQRANPAVTRTTNTTKYDKYGSPVNTNSSSTTTGGLTAQGIDEFATEQAQANPGWAEWQAVGTYFPAVMQMLGAGVPGA